MLDIASELLIVSVWVYKLETLEDKEMGSIKRHEKRT